MVDYRTSYVREDGEAAQADIFRPSSRKRRTTLRDRIARIHLGVINQDLAAAFDSPHWVGIDLASAEDITAIWVMDAEGKVTLVENQC